jgi:hypothetical protein
MALNIALNIARSAASISLGQLAAIDYVEITTVKCRGIMSMLRSHPGATLSPIKEE